MNSAIDALLLKIQLEQDRIRQARKAIFLDSKELGRVLRQERKEAGLSLRALARAMDISAQYLMDLEAGRRTWSTALAESYIVCLKRSQG